MKADQVAAGIACIVAAMACLAIHDTTNKLLISTLPPVLVLWFRFLFQVLVTTPSLLHPSARVLMRTRQPRLQLLRGLLLLVCSGLAILSLQRMPVAEFTAIACLTPLALTVLARFAMKEQVSGKRWLLVAGGLIGALIIVRPGGALEWRFAWLPLLMVAFYAIYQTLTSFMTRVESPMTTHFYTGWVCASALSVLALGHGFVDLTANQLLQLLLLGLAGTLGQYLMILAFSKAPASTVSPYLYTSIAFATLAGWFVFGQIPDALASLGMLVIAVCGLGAGWLSVKEQGAQSKEPA